MGQSDLVSGMATSSKSKSYSRRSIGAVLLVGVLAGITVGGGVGVFAASSTKTVTVCVDKKDNHMNYSKDSKCKSHQYKVVLNQKGVAGAKGAAGAAGAKGDTGAAGAKGDTGAAGAAGAKGDAGVAGTNGTNGTNGTDGAAGTNGTNGTNGSGAITQQSVCDYNDEHTGFDYLEAAPSTCEGTSKTWSSDTTNLKTALSGWALRAMRAVGSGQANTTAMMTSSGSYVADTSGAAFHSDSLTCGGESDWFLGSLDEMKLMYDNLQGIGGFASSGYWSSSENAADSAWLQSFGTGSLNTSYKSNDWYVRPVRAF